MLYIIAMSFTDKNVENLRKLKYSKYFLPQQIFKFLRGCYFVFEFLTVTSFRNQVVSKIKYRRYFHHTSHYTEINRYPDLFEICHDFFQGHDAPSILSFGCSTGEEVFSLAKYLPNASIVGTDVSKWCIKECRKKNIDGQFEFIHVKSKKYAQLNNFDAIFCLAVFQHPSNHGELIDQASEYIFPQFEEQLLKLDIKLKEGGLLFIDFCDFNFMDTSLSKKYSPLNCNQNKLLRERPLFDKTNRKVSDVTESYRIFVKNG